MIRRALALAACFAAGEAAALSCVPPDVARSYARADASEDRYVVVHGHLIFDDGLLPSASQDGEGLPEGVDIPARIEGTSLSRAGFARAFENDLTLRVICFGPWCGRLPSGAEVLAFLQVSPTGYVLDLGPCGGTYFRDPTGEMLDTAARCLRNGACETKK